MARMRKNTTVARKKWALLIGINEYSLEAAQQLQGCINDVARLMQPLLSRWGFAADDMVLLADKYATLRTGFVRAEKA